MVSPPTSISKKLAWGVFFFFLFIYILTSTGGIASSDGLTMFYVTQSLVERGEVSVPGGNTTPGRDGKLYARSGLGLSLVAIPFYIAGKAAAALAPANLQGLAAKGLVSLTNAFISAGACLIFFLICIRLGYSRRLAFWLTLGFGVSSYFFPYTKSFLTEPLQTLCFLGAFYGLFVYAQTGSSRGLIMAGIFSGMGLLTKAAFILNLALLSWYFVKVSREKSPHRFWRHLFYFVFPILLAGLVTQAYNFARFGNIFTTGYGREASLAGFSTPLYVGLHGMLFSSGKGFFWFTPLAIMGLFAFPKFTRPYRREAFLFGAVLIVNLLFYAKFKSWAGEGSWGPRYLVPLVPFLLLPIGGLLKTGLKKSRYCFFGLLLSGFLIQLAGVSIYFGTYYREIGEYPYQREFTDPLFLYQSRFVPNYSQIVGQWEMLIRNAGMLLAGEKITLKLSNADGRIPLAEDAVAQLRYTLDYWFAYAVYSGVNGYFALAGILGLWLGIFFSCKIVWREIRMGWWLKDFLSAQYRENLSRYHTWLQFKKTRAEKSVARVRR